MDYTVAGVKQMEFNPLQGDGFIGIDKQRHITAAGYTFLNKRNQFLQQLLFVAAIFFQQVLVRFFIQFSAGDKRLQVFFYNQRLRDGIGFYFLVA